MTEDIFRVKWDTGYIETLVSSFFVEANVPRIKKLFKLAQQHCTEKQKTELLAALACADKERENLLNALGELAYKKSVLANQFYKTQCMPMPEQGWAEKRASRERVRLQRAMELLKKAERWGV